MFSLHEPGPELAGTHRKGDAEHVMVGVNREGKPPRWEVRLKSDVIMLEDGDRGGGGKL